MYVTAHRIRSAQNRVGINAFLYQHGDSVVPGMSWDQPLVAPVADEHIGTRVAEKVEVAPGGNHVMSYLDVVAADETSADAIEQALNDFEKRITTEALPVTRTLDRVAIGFGTQFGPAERVVGEFRDLAVRAMDLVRNPQKAPRQSALLALAIDVTLTPEMLTLALRPRSIERLRRVHGQDWQAPRINITHTNKADLEEARGDLFRDLIPVITGLELERVAELGGVHFYHAQDGRLLREWPAR